MPFSRFHRSCLLASVLALGAAGCVRNRVTPIPDEPIVAADPAAIVAQPQTEATILAVAAHLTPGGPPTWWRADGSPREPLPVFGEQVPPAPADGTYAALVVAAVRSAPGQAPLELLGASIRGEGVASDAGFILSLSDHSAGQPIAVPIRIAGRPPASLDLTLSMSIPAEPGGTEACESCELTVTFPDVSLLPLAPASRPAKGEDFRFHSWTY